ncbi:MAG: CRTAC1 family protein [Vicinamibacterales bacterium]
MGPRWSISLLVVSSLLAADPLAGTADSSTGSSQRPVASAGPAGNGIFADVTDAVGVSFVHYNGLTGELLYPEIMGSGAALFDFDNDGDLDLFLVQGSTLRPGDDPRKTVTPWRGPGAPMSRLYRNDLKAGATGAPRLTFTDVTEASRLIARGYGMGVATGDINNDGWIDLYVTNLEANQLWLNRGDGTFVDTTAQSGTGDTRWGTSASFVDVDRDGWLDLFVTNYVRVDLSRPPACFATTSARDYCGPKTFPPVPDVLFRNKGDGTFQDVSAASGITREFGAGLGAVTDDFNGDGWVDIYVANDGSENQLWINQRNGTFRNEALLAGAALNRDGQSEAGMGVDSGDFNGDGRPDIFLTHLMEETNTLYVNMGDTMFEDRTREAGLGLGRRYTGFGTLWFDFDNDGWLDLLSANGAVRRLSADVREIYPLGQTNQLFHNTGKGTFVEISRRAGSTFQLAEVSRGAAFGDIDNDGDTDVVVTNSNGPARVLVNTVGQRNGWVGVRAAGRRSGRDMLGAIVEVHTSDTRMLRRRVHTDGGYLSAHDPRVLVGLGNSGVAQVRVRWPSGETEQWPNVPASTYVTLRQGASPAVK